MYAIDGLHIVQTVTVAHAHSIGNPNGWKVYPVRYGNGTFKQKGECKVGCMHLNYSRPIQDINSVLNDDDTIMLYIKGSLHKYWHGHNSGPFTFANQCAAISRLACQLKLDPKVAEITKAEIGTNLLTNRPARQYMAAFVAIDSKPFELRDGHTLTAVKRCGKKDKSPASLIKVYDKGREQRDNDTGSGNTNDNLLRIELVAQAHIFRGGSDAPRIRMIDLTDQQTMERMGKLFRADVKRCLVFAWLNTPDLLAASAQATADGSKGQRERWAGYSKTDRRRIRDQRRKLEAKHAVAYPLIEILKGIDSPEPKLGLTSRYRPYVKDRDRDEVVPTTWTRSTVAAYYKIDPAAFTDRMHERIASGKCAICNRPLKGSAMSTCNNQRRCRNAKSNAAHDVLDAIALQLNERRELVELLTKAMVQQRIDNRLKRAHINYRQPPPTDIALGLQLF